MNKEQLNKNLCQDFKDLQTECYELFARKQNDYGHKNITDTWNYAQVKSLVIRMTDKMSRLKNLTQENKESLVKNESLEDTLVDLSNYALIAILCMRNKWPELEEK